MTGGPPDIPAAWLAAALDAIDEGAAALGADGRVRYANAAYDPAEAAAGERIACDDGAIVVHRANATAERLYREILDELDETIAAYDVDERFLYGNRDFHRRYGHVPAGDAAIGLPFAEIVRRAIAAGFFGPGAAADGDEFMARRLEEFRTTAIGESERLTLKGEWNLVRRRLSPEGHRIGSRVDITGQKRIQEELRRTKDQLEAESAARAAYVAKLSHELRTPLSAVLGYAEMIEKELLGPVGLERYREYAGLIARSGRRMLELVDKILELSRLEAGRVEMMESSIDLIDLLRREISIVEMSARQSGTLLAVNIPGRFPALRGDPRLVRQMLTNLLSNATRHTSRGSVTLSLRRRADGGIDVVVSDTGVGMPPEVLARVGESYYRGAAATTGDTGAGLGLAVVRELMALHQGRLEITSLPGRGTTAALCFPPERSVDG